ncbi:MAG TPA: hypothetical protein DDW91_02940 [Shewanella frigidimarina]|nr:hypothetical protein [Shewanella frigidimarina]
MNTNHSKRKAEFKKASHYPLVQMFGRAMRKSAGKGFEPRCIVINHSNVDPSINEKFTSDELGAALFRDQLIGRMLRPNNEAITLDYTDNTQFFGEDYPTEKQS